ncbi:MAG TPA: LLM class flavin-dependent oxidoreductase [Candidatus Limnocylindria bacterium]|jgi:alkanesulfonate monooxygenase SsuD/methylene tetrahydromethanopterin reductase-like flavin-dependent oxidoreductase (luciferase family)|nr:LLM class flavin-dependent oxidoreductase [Candidatus Limnocylindria bacterium]
MTIRFGACLWNQYAEWPVLVDAARRADSLGYASVWVWDHLYPVVGDIRGPMLEGWMTIAAIANATTNASVGLMVGCNTFRSPALVAKMVTTLDHISGGRAILGIGAGWSEEEHEAFGFDFGSGAGERLRWLAEALPLIRAMLDGEEPTTPGPRYRVNAVRNLPRPIQERLPILVGGVGEKVTLRLVAQYADICNQTGSVEDVIRREPILQEHCRAVGRDHREVERTACPPIVVIRDSRADARAVYEETISGQGAGGRRPLSEPASRSDSPAPQPVGTVDDVVAMLRKYVAVGYRHLIFSMPSPYDEETMTRLMHEVLPQLERET